MARKNITVDQIRRMLKALAEVNGGQARLASMIGVHEALISKVIAGERMPAGKILEYLRIEKETRYIRNL